MNCIIYFNTNSSLSESCEDASKNMSNVEIICDNPSMIFWCDGFFDSFKDFILESIASKDIFQRNFPNPSVLQLVTLFLAVKVNSLRLPAN